MCKAIYQIKGLQLHKLKRECPLDEWFYAMVQKEEKELSLLDVSRMLRQEVYLDIAIPLAWNRLLKNPLSGEMYDGQLLELLVMTLEKNPPRKQKSLYEQNCLELEKKISAYLWENIEEEKDYRTLIKKLSQQFL